MVEENSGIIAMEENSGIIPIVDDHEHSYKGIDGKHGRIHTSTDVIHAAWNAPSKKLKEIWTLTFYVYKLMLSWR